MKGLLAEVLELLLSDEASVSVCLPNVFFLQIIDLQIKSIDLYVSEGDKIIRGLKGKVKSVLHDMSLQQIQILS